MDQDSKDSIVISCFPILLKEDGGHRSSSNKKKPRTKCLISFLPIWNAIFVMICGFAVLVDPLFFYIPIIHQDRKCIGMDKQLRKVVLILRSIADFFYIVDIVVQICAKRKGKTVKATLKSRTDDEIQEAISDKNDSLEGNNPVLILLIDIIAVLPLPQVVILISFPKLWNRISMDTRIIMNYAVLFQYALRVLRIYLLDDTPASIIRRLLYLYPFILAGHAYGALWYFFAIQREASCWEYACQSSWNGCETNAFHCDANTFNNITLLNNLCPINPPNTTVFDFGIFQDALQSGLTGPATNFKPKLFQCFWWGLRNLSSLGQNLETSSYEWEIVFAVLLLLTGMHLFIIYLGLQFQTPMQLMKKGSERLKIRRKIHAITPEIDWWLSKNGLPKYLNKVIRENVQKNLEENEDVNMENILTILPFKPKKHIMRLLCLPLLQKVPILSKMNGHFLKKISDHMKPEFCTANTYIIREGEPLEKMFFIMQGTAWSYKNSTGTVSSSVDYLTKGDFCGHELINWALNNPTSSCEFPFSTINVKSRTKVHAFAIEVDKLKIVISQSWCNFKRECPEIGLDQWEHLVVISLQRAWRRQRVEKLSRN